MQNYIEIPDTDTLTASRGKLLNNDKTIMSCSSGTAFPTADLQVGMLCFRTDLGELYQLKDATPTWALLLNISDPNSLARVRGVFSADTRAVDHAPAARDAGVFADFKSNTTDGLADGGTYHGVITFRPYGSGISDVSGGAICQMAFTDNGNVYVRRYASATTWSAWSKLWSAANDGAGSGLEADLVNHTVDDTTNGTFYPAFTTGSAGTKTPKTSTKMTFNPSTGVFTAVDVTISSDERLKEDWADLPADFLARLAEVKHGIYTRTDTGERQAGVSAQSLRSVLGEAVNENDAGMLSVSYGNAALVAAIELAKEVKALRAELAALKESLK